MWPKPMDNNPNPNHNYFTISAPKLSKDSLHSTTARFLTIKLNMLSSAEDPIGKQEPDFIQGELMIMVMLPILCKPSR